MQQRHLKGFTLSEVLITMAVLAIFMAVTVPMFTLQKTFFGGDRDAYNCVVKDAANLTKPSCIAAVDKCKRSKNNTCTTLQYLALVYTDPAYTVLGKACTDGGEQACSVLINRCIANSANCNVDTKNYFQADLTTVDASDKTYDVNHFLTMKATDNTAGKETMYNLLKEKIALGISNIANSIITACSVDSSNMACTLLSHKVYHFETDDEPDFIEQSSEFGTIFKSSKAQLVSSAIGNSDSVFFAYAWGYNMFGQIGDGTNGNLNNRFVPTQVKDTNGNYPGLSFSSITSNSTTCALTSSGTAYCWGENSQGAVGNNSIGAQENIPKAVSTNLNFSQISSKGYFTCGLSGGAAYCWGYNNYGQLGDNNTSTRRLTPYPVSTNLTFSQISAGGSHACGLSGGIAYCWGSNSDGQIGDNTTGGANNRYVPTQVKDPAGGPVTYSKIYAGNRSTCALTSGGKAYCWGYGWRGVLGDNGASQSNIPKEVLAPNATSPGLTFSKITPPMYHTCGITTSGDAYCWGQNDYGKLGIGDNTTLYKLTPTPVSGGLKFSEISTGNSHTCGITTSGDAYCWGNGSSGTIGDNTSTDKSAPTAVSGGLKFSKIEAGVSNAVGLVPASVYYITTSDTNNIINIKSKVIKATITQTTTANTDIKYLVSFDGRATWQMYNGASWSTVNTSSGLSSAYKDASTKTQIEAGLNNYTLPSGFNNVDIAALLYATNPASATPLLDKIDIWYY